MSTPCIHLKPGREKSLKRRHPWVFSGAVAGIEGEPQAGETVRILSHKKEFLALAAYSPSSQIQGRVWSFNENEQIDADFFKGRIAAAKTRREQLHLPQQTTGYRLIASESDGLPGLIVDHYNDYLVAQFLAQGTEYWKNAIVDGLKAAYPDHNIYERSDVKVREKEDLQLTQGALVGDKPNGLTTISENGYQLLVDIKEGHKTGFYLDQRDSRKAIQKYVEGKTVLNCFSYTGGFSVSALIGSAAHVTNIDESQPALEIAAQNLLNNNFSQEQFENIQGDVFKQLRRYRDQVKTFDVIILDPPKFADNKSQLNRACRGYKDINLWALKLLKPGGILATFSCSGLISPDLFGKTVADAAVDAGKNLNIVERLHQGPDHPTSIHFPEGHYLKGLICQVL